MFGLKSRIRIDMPGTPMRTVNALIAAGQTDVGTQRNVNEDRLHCDVSRGIFIVVDGVGGQAAGGKAADVALSMLRKRLERETGSTSKRVREAIAIANNEICRLAASRPEWSGMACVLTVAVVSQGRATIGHVGDTRLYKLRGERIEKVTRDHSPVGEREDAKELSEQQAMRHPRRNEVYRDVGSEPHTPSDPEFVDIEEISFEADAALLLCSDGLSDQVESAAIADVVNHHAGEPEAVVRTLVDRANAAGGKDNVTIVYVEGEQFAASQAGREITRSLTSAGVVEAAGSRKSRLHAAVIAIVLLAAGFAFGLTIEQLYPTSFLGNGVISPAPDSQIVQPGEAIAAAIERAAPGTQVIVEPGEYRERVFLKTGVSLVSRVPRGATIRLPSVASDTDSGAAVVATGTTNAELAGFRIVGDAATPLVVGISVAGGTVSISDVEVSGATKAGIDFGEGSSATLLGSEIHDNRGVALFIHTGANLRIANNVFSKNGMSEHAPGSFVVEAGSMPRFERNVFVGLGPEGFVTLDEIARLSLKQLNWFIRSSTP
jgi:serine/threonine protein phosphatase PrpC